jgi:hypothetical protein
VNDCPGQSGLFGGDLPDTTKGQRTPEYTAAFERWWAEVCWLKVGKRAAAKAYKSAVIRLVGDGHFPRSQPAHSFLLARGKRYAESPHVARRREAAEPLMHPSTWLNGDRFHDDDAVWGYVILPGRADTTTDTFIRDMKERKPTDDGRTR